MTDRGGRERIRTQEKANCDCVCREDPEKGVGGWAPERSGYKNKQLQNEKDETRRKEVVQKILDFCAEILT